MSISMYLTVIDKDDNIETRHLYLLSFLFLLFIFLFYEVPGVLLWRKRGGGGVRLMYCCVGFMIELWVAAILCLCFASMLPTFAPSPH